MRREKSPLEQAEEAIREAIREGSDKGMSMEPPTVSSNDISADVDHPSHYQLPGLGIEAMDVIESVLGDNIQYFYLGNVIKYILRAGNKNGFDDMKKADTYLDRYVKKVNSIMNKRLDKDDVFSSIQDFVEINKNWPDGLE